MMEHFLRHYRERGAPLVLLYPFRPDFYRQMGFGYGTKINRYRVEPAALPRGPSKARVRNLGEGDRQAVLDCYTRVVDRTHGMIEKSEAELKRLLTRSGFQVVGCEIDGQIRGYFDFAFRHGELAHFLPRWCYSDKIAYADALLKNGLHYLKNAFEFTFREEGHVYRYRPPFIHVVEIGSESEHFDLGNSETDLVLNQRALYLIVAFVRQYPAVPADEFGKPPLVS